MENDVEVVVVMLSSVRVLSVACGHSFVSRLVNICRSSEVILTLSMLMDV
jgi:hypothetical protein